MLLLSHEVTNHILSICSFKSTGCDWSAYGNLQDVIGSLSREAFLLEGAHSSLLGSCGKKGFSLIAQRTPAPRQNTQMVLITIKSTDKQTLKIKICERKLLEKVFKDIKTKRKKVLRKSNKLSLCFSKGLGPYGR